MRAVAVVPPVTVRLVTIPDGTANPQLTAPTLSANATVYVPVAGMLTKTGRVWLLEQTGTFVNENCGDGSTVTWVAAEGRQAGSVGWFFNMAYT